MYPLGFREANLNFDIKPKDLMAAIEHLHCASNRIQAVYANFAKGTISGIEIDKDLLTGYHEINKSRLLTENIPVLEEVLQTVLASLYSVWAMNYQLWEQGYTVYGVRSILSELDDAYMGVKCCLEQMENNLNLG